jgi:hypothetical protein
MNKRDSTGKAEAGGLDKLVKCSKLLAAVIPALDNNTQGQASAGIQ